MAGSDELISIAEAADSLGVPMPTLRSWERRYGIPSSARAAGSHRRYSTTELQAIRLMRDEIGRGQRASLAAQSVRTLLGIDGPARPISTGCFARPKIRIPIGCGPNSITLPRCSGWPVAWTRWSSRR